MQAQKALTQEVREEHAQLKTILQNWPLTRMIRGVRS